MLKRSTCTWGYSCISNIEIDPGADIIGKLSVGSHCCLFYRPGDDIADILVPYFEAGLKNGEYCIYVPPDPSTGSRLAHAFEARIAGFGEYRKKGQIEVIPYDGWYAKNGTQDLDGALARWGEKLRKALATGYTGLRTCGDVGWLESSAWNEILAYERKVDRAIGTISVIALCLYPLDESDTGKLLDIASVHGACILKRDGRWTLIENALVDEYRRSGAAARSRQGELQAFIDGLPGGAIAKDRTGRILMANKTFCDCLGLSHDGMVGKTYRDLFPADFAKKYEAYDRQVLETGEPLFIEDEIAIRGKAMAVATRLIPLKDGEGRVTGLIGLGLGITEVKRAQQALKESEEKYRFIVENSKDLFWKIDLQGRWTFVGGNLEKILGYRAREIVGKTVWDLVAPDCHDTIKDKMLRRMHGEDIPPYKTWILDKAGRRIPFEVSAAQICDGSGKIIGTQGISRDITMRERAESALRESEEKYRHLVERLNDWLWEIDEHCTYTYASPNVRELLGYEPEEILGKTPFDLMPESEARSVKAIFSSIFDERKPFSLLENTLAKKSGDRIIVETNGTPMFDDRGAFIGYRGVDRDITRRKQAELELKSAKAQAELYLDLMSHDISNMNQVGIGFLEMALATLNLDENGRSILSRSMGALESSTKLIDKVRKLQKARSGGLSRQEIDLGQTLSDVCAYYSRILAENTAIGYAPVPGCTVIANELLYDVFSNIVDNAIKHAKDEPAIHIRLDKADGDGGAFYRVTIEDNGHGVPDELKAQIFDRFHRGDTKAKGRGLGLYLAKALVESYHGRVWVEDRVPGDHTKGCKFVVLLPAAPSMADKCLVETVLH